MSDPFDPGQFAAHLRKRWRIGLVPPAAAAGAALIAGLFITPRYTARVSLIIEPPGSSDPRASMAVSPVYLESLRTYEHLAAGDELFERAITKFDLRRHLGEEPFEKLKQRSLRVSMPRNTKVLEIAVTLPDARRAHEVAGFLADETIRLSRGDPAAGEDSAVTNARRAAADAERDLAAAEAALRRAEGQAPTPASLAADLLRLRDQRTEVDRLALSAALSVAEQEDRLRELAAAGPDREWDAAQVRSRLSSTEARAARLKRQIAEMDSESATRQRQLAERRASIESLTASVKSARAAVELERRRLRDLQSMNDLRGERIMLLDPGVVPERPSSPDLLLNAVAAAGLSLVACLCWISVEFALQSQKPAVLRALPRAVAKQ